MAKKSQTPPRFMTNPHKAQNKVSLYTNLMNLSLALFAIIWAIAPERLTFVLILQFVLAIPLFYVSCISYTKIAYRKEVKSWNVLGWFTGITATAFVMNIIGILIYLLGYTTLAYVYFFFLWILMAIYTVINARQHPREQRSFAYFKFLYFVAVQVIFAISIIYL
jgi:hypothetical protein